MKELNYPIILIMEISLATLGLIIGSNILMEMFFSVSNSMGDVRQVSFTNISFCRILV